MSSSSPCEPKFSWVNSSGESIKVDGIRPRVELDWASWASWVCSTSWTYCALLSWGWPCEEVGLDFLIGGSE